MTWVDWVILAYAVVAFGAVCMLVGRDVERAKQKCWRAEAKMYEAIAEKQRQYIRELREQRDAAIGHRKVMIAVGKIGRSKALRAPFN